jgi:hypothetical protein
MKRKLTQLEDTELRKMSAEGSVTFNYVFDIQCRWIREIVFTELLKLEYVEQHDSTFSITALGRSAIA